MSEHSMVLLDSDDKKLHQQLDLLIAAMAVIDIVLDPKKSAGLQTMSQKEQDGWFKDKLKEQLVEMEVKGLFLAKRALKVYRLYEPIFKQVGREYILHQLGEVSNSKIQEPILKAAAKFIDRYKNSNSVEDFLRQDAQSIIRSLK